MSDIRLPALCKFRSFGEDPEQRERVFDLLQGRLYFAPITDFNDPFEGRPCPIPAHQNAARQREEITRYAIKIYARAGLSPTAARKRVATFFSAGGTVAEVTRVLGSKLHETLADPAVRIFCMSSEEAVSAPLTWSHYADGHRGVCIHFDPTKAPFLSAFKVIYSDEYPEVIFPRTARPDADAVDKGLRTKSALWAYEHEYRMFRALDGDAYALGVPWQGCVAAAEPRSVVKITLGARMPNRIVRDVVEWIQSNTPHVEIWRARLHDRRYAIVSEPLSSQ